MAIICNDIQNIANVNGTDINTKTIYKSFQFRRNAKNSILLAFDSIDGLEEYSYIGVYNYNGLKVKIREREYIYDFRFQEDRLYKLAIKYDKTTETINVIVNGEELKIETIINSFEAFEDLITYKVTMFNTNYKYSLRAFRGEVDFIVISSVEYELQDLIDISRGTIEQDVLFTQDDIIYDLRQIGNIQLINNTGTNNSYTLLQLENITSSTSNQELEANRKVNFSVEGMEYVLKEHYWKLKPEYITERLGINPTQLPGKLGDNLNKEICRSIYTTLRSKKYMHQEDWFKKEFLINSIPVNVEAIREAMLHHWEYAAQGSGNKIIRMHENNEGELINDLNKIINLRLSPESFDALDQGDDLLHKDRLGFELIEDYKRVGY